ncbi:MAG TPA: penicillin-binding transpeptidase domain-containing protein [Acidimicrobiales bacterium]
MGRRIRWLGVVMVVCLGLVVVQLVNIQLVKGKSLATSQYNPRIAVERFVNPRGEILASDGTVLAKSVSTPAGTNRTDYPYDYVRQYPQGPLYADITGYDSPLTGAVTDIENYYDSYLGAHTQSAQTLSQLLFREKLPSTTDNVSLTVEPNLQNVAQQALSAVPGKNDGAVVVLNPKTGAVLAMVSSPTYDPNALSGTSLAADNFSYYGYTQKDGEGFYPLRSLATSEFFEPGSTMKVVTSTAVYNLKPNLIDFDYPVAPCQKFTDSNKILCNDGSSPANSTPCGGTMVAMLPASCDPGYGELGIQVGVSTLRQQAQMFGLNSVPPIDLPQLGQQPVGGVIASTIGTGTSGTAPLPSNAQADQAYTSIGQEFVKDTALQNAMVAAGIANGGVIMTPHLMSSIHDSTGALVKSYAPTAMARSASAASAQAVTNLMESVPISGTASGVGFPSYLCAAVKTGTAQTGLGVNHDWMIGFAPANNPQIAVAVVVPYQNISSDGAQIAGPIVKTIMQAALPPGSVQQPCTVPMPPSSSFGH